MILKLDLGLEVVGGGPCLGKDEAVLWIGVLCLDIAVDGVRLVGLGTGYFESNVGGGFGLDFKRSAMEMEIFAEQVVGRLAKVLY